MKFSWICDECSADRGEVPEHLVPEAVRRAVEVIVAREGEPSSAWHVADEWHLAWQSEARVLWAEVDGEGRVEWISSPVGGGNMHWFESPLESEADA